MLPALPLAAHPSPDIRSMKRKKLPFLEGFLLAKYSARYFFIYDLTRFLFSDVSVLISS